VRDALLARNRVKGGRSVAEPVAVSALTGQGADDLLRLLDLLLGQTETMIRATLDPADGAAIAWVYANGRVLERSDSEKTIRILIAADTATLDRFVARLGDRIQVVGAPQRRTAIS
jgi:GTP-binding protein HflX